MGNEAMIARQNALQFECKKDALRQNQDGSWKATVNIHPNEMPPAFLGDPMGQRYVCVLVALNDDETPRVNAGVPTEGSPVKSFSARARALCGVDDFQEYCSHKYAGWLEGIRDGLTPYALASNYIKTHCLVNSKNDIDGSDAAMEKFQEILNGFTVWKNYERAR